MHELRDSENRYRTLLTDLPIGVSETSPDGDLLYFNPRAYEFNGYQPEDIGSIRAEDVYVRPRDRERLIDSLNKVGPFSYEHQIRRKDGRLIWVRGSSRAIKSADGAVTRFIGIQADIAQERQAGAIRRSVEILREEIWTMRSERDIERVLIAMRQVMETLAIPFVGCGINVIDDSTSPPSVRHHNMTPDGQWQQTSGSRGTGLVYRFWRDGHTIYRPDIVDDDHFDEAAHIEQIIAHPVRSVIDIPFTFGTLAFNSHIPDAFSAAHVQFMEEVTGVLDEFFRRVEDLKLLEAKEEQLRVAQKMEAIGHLAGGIAHDFNNLTTVIIGNLVYLLEDLGEGDPRQEDARDAYDAARRCSALVEQLLAFSARKVSVPINIEINETIADLHKMLRRIIGENIELTIDLEPDIGTIFIDRNRLEQVLLNLALNARDAMPDGAGWPSAPAHSISVKISFANSPNSNREIMH